MNEQQVVVTDINMRFGSMVVFMIKWSLASIPAMFVLGAMCMVMWLVFAVVIFGLTGLSNV